jgi:hypothetical protein
LAVCAGMAPSPEEKCDTQIQRRRVRLLILIQ